MWFWKALSVCGAPKALWNEASQPKPWLSVQIVPVPCGVVQPKIKCLVPIKSRLRIYFLIRDSDMSQV